MGQVNAEEQLVALVVVEEKGGLPKGVHFCHCQILQEINEVEDGYYVHDIVNAKQ